MIDYYSSESGLAPCNAYGHNVR